MRAGAEDKYLSLAGVVQGNGIARFVPKLEVKHGRVSIRVHFIYVKIKHNKYMWLFIVFYSYYRHHPSVNRPDLVPDIL